MVGDNVRIFTEAGNIVPCPIKCLMANIHDIKYSILDNTKYKDGKSVEVENFGIDFVNSLIRKIQSTKIDKETYKSYKDKIELIGENVIRIKLLQILNDNRV